jgi:hypothetical protein
MEGFLAVNQKFESPVSLFRLAKKCVRQHGVRFRTESQWVEDELHSDKHGDHQQTRQYYQEKFHFLD